MSYVRQTLPAGLPPMGKLLFYGALREADLLDPRGNSDVLEVCIKGVGKF